MLGRNVWVILVALPRLSNYLATNQRKEYEKTATDIFKMFMMILLPVMVGIFVTSDAVIEIIVHTGQRRLARNLLRDVVGRYVGNEPDSLYALNEIQKVAALMRFELERGKIDEFADLLNYHWELSRKVDAGSTNTLIDQIFLSIEDLIDAKMVCGAGGGGFLQVILKKGVQKADVHKRLKDVFQDNPVDVWDCEII